MVDFRGKTLIYLVMGLLCLEVLNGEKVIADGESKRLPPHMMEGLEAWKQQQAAKNGITPTPTKPTIVLPEIDTSKNIQISLKKIIDQTEFDRAFSLLMRHTGTHHDMQIGNGWIEGGFTVRYMRKDFMIQLQGLEQSLKIQQVENLKLILANGTSGSIHIGNDRINYPFIYRGFRYDSDFLKRRFIGATMQVHAIQMPNGLVRVTLTPIFTGLIDDTDTKIETFSSTVFVPDGGALVVGGLPQSGQSAANSLFMLNHGEKKRNMLLLLKVDVITLR